MLSNTLNKPDYQAKMTSMFEWMPTCTLVLDKSANILDLNQQALLFFKTETKELFFEKLKVISVFVDLLMIEKLIQETSKCNGFVSKKLLLRRFDKTIACIDTTTLIFPENENYILFQFTDNSHQIQHFFTQLALEFRNEILRLKPYLNKPGKELLEEIIGNEKLDGIINNKPFRNRQFDLIHEKRIIQLKGLFPDLSNSELALCSFLSLKMSIEEIATITGKTSNSLRVAYHRILRKTNFENGKDFLNEIENFK